ncbi:MAG: TraX protein [Clostridia bacterium]|nr:TraX protein [Clostridia bacterium]
MKNRDNLPFTGNILKTVAVVTMLIDHIGAVFFPTVRILRIIGRLAMPIYCYTIVTGAQYTHDKRKYLLRMTGFALLSEIPFDMAFNDRVLEFSYQNVIFTLTIGLLCVFAADYCKNKISSRAWLLPAVAVFAFGGAAAELLRADYGCIGVAFIAGFYFFKDRPALQTLALLFSSTMLMMLRYQMTTLPLEIYAVFAMVIILLYNGKRGRKTKLIQYAFYIFYPAHLLVIGILHMWVL